MELDSMKALIENDYLEEDIKKLSHKDRIGVYLNLCEFYRAKLSRGSEPPAENFNEIVVKHVYTQTDAPTGDTDNSGVSGELEEHSGDRDNDK